MKLCGPNKWRVKEKCVPYKGDPTVLMNPELWNLILRAI